MIEITPHQIEWTRERSSRFWKYMAANADEQAYFSRAVGKPVIKHAVKRGVRLQGNILDFGCGPGYLLEILLQMGVPCSGADFDPAALEATRKRVGTNKHFRGATLLDGIPSGLADQHYDVAFLVETIEHLLPGDLEATLEELHRIMRPGAFLVLTTPNKENLDLLKTLCPECGAIFHRVQHLSSWDVDKLVSLMSQRGFDRVCCEVTQFRPPSPLNPLRMLRDVARRWKPANLFYVGRRV